MHSTHWSIVSEGRTLSSSLKSRSCPIHFLAPRPRLIFLSLLAYLCICLPHHPTQDTIHLGPGDLNSSKGASYSLFTYMVSIFLFQCLFYFLWFEGHFLWWRRQMAIRTCLLLFCCPINIKPPLRGSGLISVLHTHFVLNTVNNIKATFGVFCKPQTILSLVLCNSPEEEALESVSSLSTAFM